VRLGVFENLKCESFPVQRFFLRAGGDVTEIGPLSIAPTPSTFVQSAANCANLFFSHCNTDYDLATGKIHQSWSCRSLLRAQRPASPYLYTLIAIQPPLLLLSLKTSGNRVRELLPSLPVSRTCSRVVHVCRACSYAKRVAPSSTSLSEQCSVRLRGAEPMTFLKRCILTHYWMYREALFI
jgi:hypothetical protein